jgi:hypothetical protein
LGALMLKDIENTIAEWNGARVVRARWRTVLAVKNIHGVYYVYCAPAQCDAMQYDGVLI